MILAVAGLFTVVILVVLVVCVLFARAIQRENAAARILDREREKHLLELAAVREDATLALVKELITPAVTETPEPPVTEDRAFDTAEPEPAEAPWEMWDAPAEPVGQTPNGEGAVVRRGELEEP